MPRLKRWSYTAEDDTTVPKRIGVLIIILNRMLLSLFVVGCIDFKNTHCINNKINAYIVDQRTHRWTDLDFECRCI